MIPDHPFGGRFATMATLHDKAQLVEEHFMRHLGVKVRGVPLDTDRLGTFSGEIERPCPPLEAAVAKAKMGMAHTGCDLGLGSEGYFAPHPEAAIITCQTEILACVMGESGRVVHESLTRIGPVAFGTDAAPGEITVGDLERAGFPEHGLIVRPSGSFAPIHKGVHQPDELRDLIGVCAALSAKRTARVETDFRANHHPSRRVLIAAVAEKLAIRLATLCPYCAAPGWGTLRIEAGAPCRACARPTSSALVEVHGCSLCDAESVLVVAPAEGADPVVCQWCNP